MQGEETSRRRSLVRGDEQGEETSGGASRRRRLVEGGD